MAKTRSNRGSARSKTQKRRSATVTPKKTEAEFIKTFIHKMFSLQLTLKMVHWSTKSYAVHKATDGGIEKVLPLIDSFVETFLGKHEHELKQDAIKSVKIEKMTTKNALQKYIKETTDYLYSLNAHMKSVDGDLASIRDELASELNVLKYLLDLEK